MSPKTLIIAAAALAASTAITLPASAAEDQSENRAMPLRAQVLFNLVDVNGDGAIDQTEIVTLQKAVFSAIDANNDGKLSEEEFVQIRDNARARLGHFMSRRGPGGPDGPGFHRRPRGDRQGQLEQQGPGQGPGPGGGMMQQLGEEQGSPERFPMGEPRNFASLDTNGDGVVSQEEFATGAARLPILPQ